VSTRFRRQAKCPQILQLCFAFDERSGDKALEATALNNIGRVYSDLGDKQSALKYFNSALPLIKEVGYKDREATILGNIANVERDRGNLQAARTNVEAAIKIIEELRTKIDRQELRTSYFATVQGYYKFYIDLLMQLHKKEPSQGYAALALHYSDRSRARSLIELLTEANANILKAQTHNSYNRNATYDNKLMPEIHCGKI
jgi:tetratricopeptide (TPR) repeat protein